MFMPLERSKVARDEDAFRTNLERANVRARSAARENAGVQRLSSVRASAVGARMGAAVARYNRRLQLRRVAVGGDVDSDEPLLDRRPATPVATPVLVAPAPPTAMPATVLKDTRDLVKRCDPVVLRCAVKAPPASDSARRWGRRRGDEAAVVVVCD